MQLGECSLLHKPTELEDQDREGCGRVETEQHSNGSQRDVGRCELLHEPAEVLQRRWRNAQREDTEVRNIDCQDLDIDAGFAFSGIAVGISAGSESILWAGSTSISQRSKNTRSRTNSIIGPAIRRSAFLILAVLLQIKTLGQVGFSLQDDDRHVLILIRADDKLAGRERLLRTVGIDEGEFGAIQFNPRRHAGRDTGKGGFIISSNSSGAEGEDMGRDVSLRDHQIVTHGFLLLWFNVRQFYTGAYARSQ